MKTEQRATLMPQWCDTQNWRCASVSLPANGGRRRPRGDAVALDAGLRPPRRSHADARLRRDARGRDGGVLEELAAGVVQLKPTTGLEATSILPP